MLHVRMGGKAPSRIGCVLGHLNALVEVHHILDSWFAHTLGSDRHIDHQVRSCLPRDPAKLANQAAEACDLLCGERSIDTGPSVLSQGHVVHAFNGVELIQLNRAIAMLLNVLSTKTKLSDSR